ncbi:MAG TPA: hypothetical protein VK934_06365, partial [Fimbriimonas sp.]|nr:hypothetical protein [Fimbriimonas sp.]
MRSKIGAQDVLRRALGHLDKGTALALVGAVEEERASLPEDKRTADVPFLPGPAPLAGDTAKDRDLAFGKQLQKLGLTLVASPIETREEAFAAADQILNVDLTTLRTGVPLDPLSRDVIRERHGLLGDWIADRPVSLGPDYQAAYDAYTQSP